MATILNDGTSNRTYKLRLYMFNILDNLLSDTNYQLNANFLSNDINSYSLDKMPVAPILDNWIIPVKLYREVYEFRSRNTYGFDELENLKNIGFFEEFENKIYSNNMNKILPNIDGIEKISCLNWATLNSTNGTDEAEFVIQIEIQFHENKTTTNNSL